MSFLDYNEQRGREVGKLPDSVKTGKFNAKIEKAYYSKRKDGAIDATLECTPVDFEGKTQFIKLNLVTTDQKDGYDIKAWDAILGILNIKTRDSLRITHGQEEIFGQLTPVDYVNGLNGREIGFLIRKDYYGNSQTTGKPKFSWDVKLVYDIQTERTLDEIIKRAPAQHVESYAAVIKDRIRPECNMDMAYTSGNHNTVSTPVMDIPTEEDIY